MRNARPDEPEWTGGAFLVRETEPAEIFTPEDLTEEHQAVAQTTEEFFRSHLEGKPEADHAGALRRAAELGLTVLLVPERYGGMDLDIISAALAAGRLAGDGRYALRHCDLSGPAVIPLLWYGSGAQRERFLPPISAGESVAAQCLAGTVGAAPDNAGFSLSAERLFCRNASQTTPLLAAGVSPDGEHSVFVIDAGAAGVSAEPDGSLALERVAVEPGAVLGEKGQGPEIVRRALALEKLLHCHAASGAAREIAHELLDLIRAANRDSPPDSLVRQAAASVAVQSFAAESSAYRLTGMVQRCAAGGTAEPAAIEEFLAECALARSMVGRSLEAVLSLSAQIRGQLAWRRTGAVERSWREALEDTPFPVSRDCADAAAALTEPSRLGRLSLFSAAERVADRVFDLPVHPAAEDRMEAAAMTAAGAKRIALYSIGAALRQRGLDLANDRALMAALGELAGHALMAESAALRARKLQAAGTAGPWADAAWAAARDELDAALPRACSLLSACFLGDDLRTGLTVLRRLAAAPPHDAISSRERIAEYLLDTGGRWG